MSKFSSSYIYPLKACKSHDHKGYSCFFISAQCKECSSTYKGSEKRVHDVSVLYVLQLSKPDTFFNVVPIIIIVLITGNALKERINIRVVDA